MSHPGRGAVAVILAAGVGKRLGDAHDGPKVLLKFGGRSLLQRRLEALAACGVEEVSISVGFEADAIRAEAERFGRGLKVSFVENARFRAGSVVSAAVQQASYAAGREVLLMDGDVLHDSRMVRRLLDAPGESALLVDPELEPGDEPVKVCFRGDRIVDFRKVPEDAGERHGESVGFFRFSPAMAADFGRRCAEMAAGEGARLEYEEAIRAMILDKPEAWAAADVGDLPWTEIDFEEDVAKARDHILPALVD